MSAKPVVLVIAPQRAADPDLLALFRSGGMSVSTVAGPDEALRQRNGSHPDLIVFDTEMPPPGGMEAFQALRDAYHAGLIVLCRNADSLACILGLEMGADDVVERSRDPREIFVRGKRLLARLEEAQAGPSSPRMVAFAGWHLDTGRHGLTDPNGRPVRLTRGEFALLAALAASPGQVLSRDALLDHVSHREWAPTDRTIDVLVNRLRRKLGEDPRDPRLIVTVHGVGYMLQA
ncbi:winged helix-turn-helix domain-containing protein [Roseospira navarrensis]|uniref:Regulatory protein VirG n=1 Tax=Roseospira navarrensis TaxID=140058 RepID=A0A7X2D4T7_9PROT|nr:winged helix-turn-helix domain-containing protein [Roseospira navarrensis]MQX38196.1 response regulator [Roseospira navarrensis]